MKRFLVFVVPLILAACSQAPTPEADAPIDLAPTFGTPGEDRATGLARHSSGVYMVGTTTGNLHGVYKSQRDVFIRKEDEYGGLLWGVQFGTNMVDEVGGVAVDASNNAYIVGTTFGYLAGTHRGNGDMYIRKYDAVGNHLWTRQVGTSGKDIATGVAIYGDSVYLVGSLNSRPFVSKYSTGGIRVWTRHSSTVNPVLYTDVAVDPSGNVYTSGAISFSSGQDMAIRKLSPSGGIIWSRYVDHNSRVYDVGTAVAVLGSYVYLVGNYAQDNNHQDYNIAVTKFTIDGAQLWGNTYGAYGQDIASDVSTDSNGDLYITGTTQTSFFGPNQGLKDAYVVKVSNNGFETPLWSKTVGTSAVDEGNAVVVRTLFTYACTVRYSPACNQIYTSGSTYGTLPYVPNQGGLDAYLRRLYSHDGGTVWTK